MFCAFCRREKITEAILAFGTVFSPKPYGILLDQNCTISTPFFCVTPRKIAECPCSCRPTLGFQNIFMKSPGFAAFHGGKFGPRSNSRKRQAVPAPVPFPRPPTPPPPRSTFTTTASPHPHLT